MVNKKRKQLTKQDLSEGELVEQKSLEAIKDPLVQLAGYNRILDSAKIQKARFRIRTINFLMNNGHSATVKKDHRQSLPRNFQKGEAA